MDRLTEQEYLEQVKQVLSEKEYTLLLEVSGKTTLENTTMDKTDIISLCVEMILQSRKKEAHVLSTDRKKEVLRMKMQKHIKNNTPKEEADSIEAYQEEVYMDNYNDDSLKRLMEFCKDSSNIPKSDIVLQKLQGKKTVEISRELGISIHTVERIYTDKIARIKSLYYDAIAGIMDERLYNYYQEQLKNPVTRQRRWNSSSNILQINSALNKYKKGHQLTKTEKQIYETISEMNQTSQQKVLKKI